MKKIKVSFFIIFTCQLCFIGNTYSQAGLRDEDILFSQGWLEQVQTSGLKDDLLVAAIVAQAHDLSLASQFLSKAMEMLEHDSILLSAAIYHCYSGGPSEFCQDNSIFEELIQLDSDNLEPYLYYLVRLIDTDDEEGALQVLTQGMETTQHNDYFFDKVKIINQKLVSAGYPSEAARYPSNVYANAPTFYSIYANINSICSKQSITSQDWKLTCLFLGARLGNSSKGMLPNVFGGAIQRDVLIAIDADPDVIQLISERREWDNKIRDLAAEKLGWWTNPFEQPESFINEQMEIPEREAILRAIYRTQ